MIDIKIIVYLILLVICAYTDEMKGKIYNKYLIMYIIFFICAYGREYLIYFIQNALNDYFPANSNAPSYIDIINENMFNNLFGLIVGFVISFLLYLMGVFKGGDAKLLTITGMVSGLSQIFIHYSLIIIVAGIAALVILLKNRILIARLKRLYYYFKNIVLTRQFSRYNPEENDNIKFPLALYVLISELLCYWFIVFFNYI